MKTDVLEESFWGGRPGKKMKFFGKFCGRPGRKFWTQSGQYIHYYEYTPPPPISVLATALTKISSQNALNISVNMALGEGRGRRSQPRSDFFLDPYLIRHNV